MDHTNTKKIGKILEIKSNTDFEFYINNESTINIDDLIGFEIESSIWLVAQVSNIRVSYYLKDTELYFVSKASKNQLDNINPTETKYALIGKAVIIGFFEHTNDELLHISHKANYLTPSPLQSIYKLDFETCAPIFGLYNDSKLFSIGKIMYPFEDHEVHLNINNFSNRHTLVSGITGCGKTRLASNIIKSLINANGHIWIIDPHLEYLNLLYEYKDKISVFTKKKYSQKSYEFQKFSEEHVKTQINDLYFSSKLINAYTLIDLLPNISSHQEELLHEVFNEIDIKENDSTKNILEEIISNIQQKINIKESELESFIIDKAFIKVWDVNKYVESKNENSDYLFKAYQGLISRIDQLIKKGLFKDDLPSWLEKKGNWIDIIAEDYSSDAEGVRMINSLIHQFLDGGVHPPYSTIFIDEAHQLFKIRNEKSLFLLNRLLREARKYNLSIVFITQNTSDLPEDLLAQFSNYFRFRENGINNLKNLNNQSCRTKLSLSNIEFILNVKESLGVIDNL